MVDLTGVVDVTVAGKFLMGFMKGRLQVRPTGVLDRMFSC